MAVATFGVPYESSLDVQPILVGWCPLCEVVYDPYPGAGTTCENEHEWEFWASRRYGQGYMRGLLKRRMWKCARVGTGECDFYFATRRALIEHEHGFV